MLIRKPRTSLLLNPDCGSSTPLHEHASVNQSSFFCLAARFDLDPNLTDRNIFLNLFVNIFTLSSNSNASTGNKSQLTVSSPGMLEMYKF